MMTKDKPETIRRAFSLTPEVLEAIQALADAKYDGNASQALRSIVREFTAKQNGGK